MNASQRRVFVRKAARLKGRAVKLQARHWAWRWVASSCGAFEAFIAGPSSVYPTGCVRVLLPAGGPWPDSVVVRLDALRVLPLACEP